MKKPMKVSLKIKGGKIKTSENEEGTSSERENIKEFMNGSRKFGQDEKKDRRRQSLSEVSKEMERIDKKNEKSLSK